MALLVRHVPGHTDGCPAHEAVRRALPPAGPAAVQRVSQLREQSSAFEPRSCRVATRSGLNFGGTNRQRRLRSSGGWASSARAASFAVAGSGQRARDQGLDTARTQPLAVGTCAVGPVSGHGVGRGTWPAGPQRSMRRLASESAGPESRWPDRGRRARPRACW
jgi:hypothetical protein